MLEPLLLSFFFHTFQLDAEPPMRIRRKYVTPERQRTYIERRVEPEEVSSGGLHVTQTEVLHSAFPKGAQKVPLLRLKLEASCEEDVVVESIDLSRRGLGNPRDIQLVYAMSDGLRVTRFRSISSRDGSAQLRFRNQFKVPRCESRDIVVMIDVSPAAAVGGQHQFFIRSQSDVVTDAASTSIERLSSTSEPGVVSGAPAVSTLSVSYKDIDRIRYGNRRIVGRLHLENTGSRDQAVSRIFLTNKGTARSNDLTNLYIEAGGNRVTKLAPRMLAKTARLDFDPPLIIQRNAARDLVVRANVRPRRRRTVRFIIEGAADIEVQEIRGR